MGGATGLDWLYPLVGWSLVVFGAARLHLTLFMQPGVTGARDLACSEYLRNPYNKPFAHCWVGSFDVPARVTPPGTTAEDKR